MARHLLNAHRSHRISWWSIPRWEYKLLHVLGGKVLWSWLTTTTEIAAEIAYLYPVHYSKKKLSFIFIVSFSWAPPCLWTYLGRSSRQDYSCLLFPFQYKLPNPSSRLTGFAPMAWSCPPSGSLQGMLVDPAAGRSCSRKCWKHSWELSGSQMPGRGGRLWAVWVQILNSGLVPVPISPPA